MAAKVQLQKQQAPSCSIQWMQGKQGTKLVAHWLTDKDGNLFRCWVKEAS